MIVDKIKKIKSDTRTLRRFGIVVGIAFAVIGALLWRRGSGLTVYFLAVAGALVLLGLVAPAVLKPVQKAWMTVAILIGWVMTRVILFVLFYLAITPIALLARLLGRDILDRKFDKAATTYWTERPAHPHDRSQYEKQF